jgi:hypothetical protein
VSSSVLNRILPPPPSTPPPAELFAARNVALGLSATGSPVSGHSQQHSPSGSQPLPGSPPAQPAISYAPAPILASPAGSKRSSMSGNKRVSTMNAGPFATGKGDEVKEKKMSQANIDQALQHFVALKSYLAERLKKSAYAPRNTVPIAREGRPGEGAPLISVSLLNPPSLLSLPPFAAAGQVSTQRASAREKLTRLTKQQFHELSTDVFDETNRRQNSATDGKKTNPNPLHPELAMPPFVGDQRLPEDVGLHCIC